MMLCEDTLAPLAPVTSTRSDAPKVSEVGICAVEGERHHALPLGLQDIRIPKNKAARRRFAQSIRNNVDKINRATQLKKKDRSFTLPSPIGVFANDTH